MQTRIRHYLLLALILPVLSGCSTVKGWFEDDVYEAPPAELVDFVAEFEPKSAWSVDTGDGAANDYDDLGAWLQGDMIIAVDNEGQISSYQAETGKLIWSIDIDVPIATGAGGGDGLVLVGTREGKVYAIDEATGVIRWDRQMGSEVLAAPKAASGVVVIKTADGGLSGLSAETGETLWAYQHSVPLLSLRGASAPIIVEDVVIAGFANGKLTAISLVDGQLIWERSVAVATGRTEIDRLVDIDADPIAIDGQIYVTAYHGKTAAVDPDSGEIIWSRDLSSRAGLDTNGDGAVYVTDDTDFVWALQDGTGDSLWRQTELLRRTITAPVVFGDYLLVGDYEGYVHWISRDDGRFVARVRVGNKGIRSKPFVRGDLVYITSSKGTLTAFRHP